MNKIVCKIDPGLGMQQVLYFDNEQLETQEVIPLKDLIPYLLSTCYKENCYDVHFIGAWPFLEGIVQNLLTEEATKYKSNKIIIGVN